MSILWLIPVLVIVFLLLALALFVRKKNNLASPSGRVAILFKHKPVVAIAAGLTISVLVIAFYFAARSAQIPATLQTPAAQADKMAPEHALVVEDMAARLEQNPNDGKGWGMLGNSYAVMGRYADAVIAYEKAVKLIPNDAQLLVDYADVMAVANDRTLRGKPLEMIDRALKIDPKNVKALALIGTAAFQAGDYPSAVKYWEKLLKLLPPDSPFAMQMSSGVAEARAMVAGKKEPSFGAAQNTAQPAAAGAQISGVLTLSPALASKVAPTDSVFLSAKETPGGHMPVAVIRAQVKDLPLKFTLDDSMAMMPEMKLSDYQSVMLSAKISKTGNTVTLPGDLKGEVASVKVGASGIRIVIDKIAP